GVLPPASPGSLVRSEGSVLIAETKVWRAEERGCPLVSECWRTASVVQRAVIAKLASDDAARAGRAVDIDVVTVGVRPDRRDERRVGEAALGHDAVLDSRRRR